MRINEILEQDNQNGSRFISGRAARRKAQGQVQTGPEEMSQGAQDAARLIISFFPGISSIYDAKDAIDAASKGEYGSAAASSAFALLGLVPLIGAGKAGAQQVSSAVKNFVNQTPLASKATSAAAKVEPAATAAQVAKAPDASTAQVAKAPDAPPAQVAIKAPDAPPAQVAAKAPDAPPAQVAAKAPDAPPAQVAIKAPETPKTLLGPDGKPIDAKAPETPKTLLGPDGKPLAAVSDKSDDVARIASLAGVSSAAGAKLVGKSDELVDIGKAAAKTDDTAAGVKVAKADDATVSKASEPSTASKQAPAPKVEPAAIKLTPAAGATQAVTKPGVSNAVKAGAVGGAALGGAAMLGAMSDNPEQDMGAGKSIQSPEKTQAADKPKADQTTSKTTSKDEPTTAKDSPKAEPTTTSKTTAPNIDTMTFNQAFAAARKAADAQGVGPTGQFTWRGKQYQTNRQGEPYVPMNQQTPVKISEKVDFDLLYRIIQMANYK